MKRFIRSGANASSRLFRFPAIGRLPHEEAAQALVTPAERLDVTYEPDAVEAIVQYTEGYPYFLQEYGKLVWDSSPRSPITSGNVIDAREAVEAKLDGGAALHPRPRTGRVHRPPVRPLHA